MATQAEPALSPAGARADRVLLPPSLPGALHTLATEAGVDDFTALSVAAGVLAARMPRMSPAVRVEVVDGERRTIIEAGSAAADTVDLSAGFRTALRQARPAGPASPPGRSDEPADVTIWISRDGPYRWLDGVTRPSDLPSARSWVRSFAQLLSALADEPDAPMRRPALVDPEERGRILHRLNPHRVPPIRYRTMTQPFEEQVERTPDAVALLDEHGTGVSYRQLNERANRLAHFLVEHGAVEGTRIGICLERGIHQVVAIYAAAKTGATYVPLDADLPNERIAFMLRDAAPRHVLTDEACRHRVPDGDWATHDVGSGDRAWSDRPATNPVVGGRPSALLHLLYTSGTTGRPKGVASPVAGALANLFWMQLQYPFGPADTALFKASPGFDISIWELFWPLYHGARLVICRPGAERDPRHLARLTETYEASQVFLVPTMMTPFLEELSPDRAAALRWVICGGEAMSPRIREAFPAKLPAAHLINAFGPTEAGPVTDNIVDPDDDSVFVPVGRPADNFRITVLDEHLDLVPVGSPGEAYISGPVGLADGYWRATARTAERFVADPYGPPGSRMYRTGDLCRFRENGLLEHLGRIDRQIKIRGNRVEPGEIESVLAAHPAVGDCAVIAYGTPPRLLGFVVPADGTSLTGAGLAAIREHAATLLPVHMRPERLVPLEFLPATVNGKIDQAELVTIWQALAERERTVVPPADELEATVADIYGRVLNTSPISMLDTFVQLGGHSMLAFRLVEECAAGLRRTPDVTWLVTATLRDVAASIRETASDQPRRESAEVGIGHPDDQRLGEAG